MYSYPFDSNMTGKDVETGFPKLDRAQFAYQLQSYYSMMFKSGILPNIENCFHVTPGTGMQIIVNKGIAIVGGAIAIEDTQRTLSVQASESSLDRVDTVVLRKDNNDNYRSVDLYVVKGTASSNPQPKPLRRDTQLNNPSSVYEIALAHIFVSRSTTSISAQRITDTRLDSKVCGVSSPYGEVDTQGIYDQYTDAFNTWFESIKGKLSGDMAGSLQLQVDGLQESKIDKLSIIPTLEEVSSNIKQGNIPDALVLKEFYSMFTNVKTYTPEFRTPTRRLTQETQYAIGVYMQIGKLVYVSISIKAKVMEDMEYARINLPVLASRSVGNQCLNLGECFNVIDGEPFSAQIDANDDMSSQIIIQSRKGENNAKWKIYGAYGYIRISGFYISE